MMTILKSTTPKAHIDYQLKKPHWIALTVLAVAIAFASIHPLEGKRPLNTPYEFIL